MNKKIHPSYQAIDVTCSCGNTFKMSSVMSEALHVDVCNECHPFFTGKQKIIDTAGSVEKFKARYGSFITKEE